jgi:hypothetical protein
MDVLRVPVGLERFRTTFFEIYAPRTALDLDFPFFVLKYIIAQKKMVNAVAVVGRLRPKSLTPRDPLACPGTTS